MMLNNYLNPAANNRGRFSESSHSSLDGDTYLVDHLVTFTVSREAGVVFPADGMRKFLQMQKTSVINTQRMQLVVDRSSAAIVSYETGVSHSMIRLI